MAQNWHFWLIWARPCRLFRCPVGGSIGGCCARAVSRKTPIYFFIYIISIDGAGLLNVPLLRLLLASFPQFDPRPESFRAKPWTSHPFSYHFKWSCHDHHGHHEHHDDYAQFRSHHPLDQSLSEPRSRLSIIFPQELPQIFCSVRIWILPEAS